MKSNLLGLQEILTTEMFVVFTGILFEPFRQSESHQAFSSSWYSLNTNI